MLTVLVIVLAVLIAVYVFMRSPQFGSLPTGKRTKKIGASANFQNGEFRNINDTPQLTNGAGIFTVSRKFFFEKDKRNKPAAVVPSAKKDLHSLAPGENVLVWFGHSSYFMQVDGKKIL